MRRFIHRMILVTLALALSLASFNASNAQTTFGRISGAVTDSNGAVVPGATITITDEATRITRSVTTDSGGSYVVTSLPVATYSVQAEAQGFKKTLRTGYDLVADGRLTVNLKLEAGAVSDTVEVTASAGETINTTSGESARVIDGSQVQDLALNGRNYMSLLNLIPGAPVLDDNALTLMTSLSVSQPINGNRGNANNLTVDGGFNLDSGSNGSQINNVGINFIKEVNIKTSNFSAEYGRNSGAAINVVTRGGGNQFHGDAFEFLRNEVLDANRYFINRTPLSAAQRAEGLTKQPRTPLRFNNFGGDIGGPIIKNKLFFFFGMEWKKIRQYSPTTLRVLPTRLERQGNFTQRLRGADGIVGTADDGVLRDPLNASTTCVAPTIVGGVVTVQAIRTGCFPGNIIPSNRITADGRAIAKVFDFGESQAFSFTDALTGNNTIYNLPSPFNVQQEIVRIDYKINDQHNIYGRYLHDDYNLIEPFGTFINSQIPTIPTNRRRPGYSYQVAHNWLLSSTLVNEARVTAAWNGQRIPPVGDAWKRETYGFTYPQLYPNGGAYDNGIPNINVNGFATATGPAASLLSPTTDISLSDTITWTKRAHTLKAGFVYIRNRKDQNGRPVYTGAVTFNSGGNTAGSGQAMADALLGNFRTYTEADSDPVGFFRFSQYDAFASDNWKVNRKLSLELGVRYQYGLPTYTQADNMVNFDPALYDKSREAVIFPNGPNSGTIDTSKPYNRYNGLIRAGSGIPQSELGRYPFGNRADVVAVPSGAPRGLFNPQHLFVPRFSFAFAPFNDNKTAIRGGFGMFYDKPEGNIIFSSVNIAPYAISGQFENGNLASITGGRASAVAPFGQIDTLDPNLVLPYSMNYSFSIQRELPWGIFGEVAYVGNQGRHLLRQPDINQPSFAALVENALKPTAQQATTNALRPYKGYSAIRMRLSDSNSNYNALQLYVTKRKGNFNFSTSYTWSKVLADTSANGENQEDPFNRSFNYGPTNYDIRHIFAQTYLYRFPFFRKQKGVVGKALKGWEISGITRMQTGRYFTPVYNSNIGTRRAEYLGGDIALPKSERSVLKWFNTAAFGRAPNEERGNAGTAIITGPGRITWDFSLKKQFALTEKVKLGFQADMFNAFNRVNLAENGGGLSVNVSDLNYGTITTAAPGRNAQLALKLTF